MTTTIANVLNGPDTKRILGNMVRREAVLKSTLRQAGLFYSNNDYDIRAAGAGNTTEIRFFDPLAGDSELGNDDLSDMIDVGGITGDSLTAVRQFRNKAWGTASLTSTVVGDNVLGAIAAGVGEWQGLDDQKVAVSMLSGVAANALANDATAMTKVGTGKMDNKLLIAAAQTKGELKNSLSVLVVHSSVQAQLAADNLITTVPASEQSPSFEVYAGKRLVVSDAMPFDAVDEVYTSLLCGPGIIAYGEAAPANGAFDVEYKPGAGNGSGGEILYTRRQFIMGIHGYSYKGTGPLTNAALATAASYERKFDPKQIPLVFIKSQVEI